MADIYVNVIIINNYSKNIPLTGEVNLYFNGHESVSLLLDDSLSWGRTTTWKSLGKGTTTYNNRKLIPSKNSSEAPSPDSYLGKDFDNNDKSGGIYITDELFNTKWGHICVYVDGTGEALANGNTYTLTINENNATLADLASNNGGNSGGNSGGDSGGTSTSDDNDSDTYNRYPSINPAGWETYNKGKRAELMYASIIPGCTDSCFFMTKYFEFGGITNKPVTLYYIKDNPSESTAKRYVFYEISEADYNNGINGSDKEHFYRIDSVFGGLGIVNYSFSGGTRNGKIDGHQYLGTTSEPDYMSNHIAKSTLYRLLGVAQEVGDTAGRQPTYGLNWGRVRPLGNTDMEKGYRQPDNPIGHYLNGFSNNTLKARFTDYTAQFKSSISSDEVHGDGPTSWPSGHSSQCWAMAMTVVQLLGLKYHINNGGTSIIDEICKYVHKAYKFGVLRTIGRFHWNSDTMYGKIFGSLIMPVLNASYDIDNPAQSFNELFTLAYKDLYPNDTISYKTLNSITYKDGENVPNEYPDWFDDFKELLREIGQKANIANIIWEPGNKDDKIFGYLWDIYKIGRSELESNTEKIFNFFSGDSFNVFYPDGDDEYYFDEDANDIVSEWHECRSWFPECFPNGHSQSIKLLESDTNTVSIGYHGTNTNYNVDNLTNIKILCSWLMAFCIAELNISEGAANNISKQTEIFSVAYDMCGARDLRLYNNYKPSHDPTYLRLLAGIIYCFCRGQYNPDDIDSIRTGTRIILDTEDNDPNTPDVIGVLNKDEANANIGNSATKDLRSEGWGDAIVKYGIDNYYIFPNAPGPYIPGRKFSKPYESNSSKPGNSNTVQPKDQFIIPGVKKSNNGGGTGTTNVTYNYEPSQPDFTQEIILKSGAESLGSLQFSVGLISDLHIYKDENKWYEEDDLEGALNIFKNKEKVEFITACGDIAEVGTNDNVGHPDSVAESDYTLFKSIFDKYYGNTTGKFFTPLGNHDFYGLFETRPQDTRDTSIYNESDQNGCNPNVKQRIDDYWFGMVQPHALNNTSGITINYFRYGAKVNNTDDTTGWRPGDTVGTLNSYSKLNYWFEKDGNIFIFISVDYGSDTWKITEGWHDRVIHARKVFKRDNSNVGIWPAESRTNSNYYYNAMYDYVNNVDGGGTTLYDSNDELYDYQYYHPNVLIWLKEIIEGNQNNNKKIFVYMHHFLPHRVGNGTGFGDGTPGSWTYANIEPSNVTETKESDNTIIYSKGSNTLTGVQFYFINKLCNRYKNVVWFNGHSHMSWKSALNAVNHDYAFIRPGDTNPAPKFYKTERQNNETVVTQYCTYYKKLNDSPHGESAWLVTLPSLSKSKIIDGESVTKVYEDAEIGVMDVYENGVKIRGYNLKRTETSGGDNDSDSSSSSTLGDIYIDIKVKNTTNHDIYITERFKFFPIAVKDGKEFWGYFYLLGSNFTNYANIKISAGETKTFSHENLRWDNDATLKDVTNDVDSTEPASYLNGITLNNGLEDAIGVYTYFNSSGNKKWGKLLPVQTKNGDNYIRQVSPNTWNIGTAGNITVYTIEVTDDNDTYWTTPS